ncbi:MAG TPA: hypothetical protein VFJ84_00205 [Candidatus Saccharimonadales bacterium]|nr:hypothetical protein [Candidatus Saccharimonadales bacterium]
MSEHAPDNSGQLAWDFETFAKGGRVTDAPDMSGELGQQIAAGLARAKHPINSVEGLEIALETTLKRMMELLSPHAQKGLLRYLVDVVPVQSSDPRPNSAYFRAAVECFGWERIFSHITAPIADLDDTYRAILEETENPQLSLDDEFGQAA